MAEGHDVRIYDRDNEAFRPKNANVDYRYGEFGNRTLVSEALIGVDIVFHLITTTIPKTSNDDPIYDVQSNVIETLGLLERCVANNIKKIVFISSGGTVYGRVNKLPISEDFPTEPECSYGITKLTIEKYLALFQHLYGLEYSVLRLSNPYGSRQNPAGIQGAISVFLDRVVQNKEIEIWGDGKIVRDYVYVEDVVGGIYAAAITNTKSHVFNLGSGIGHSLNDIVRLVGEITGRPAKVVYKPRRLFDVPKIYLNIKRAEEELNWKPSMPLEQGLEHTLEFIKSLHG